MVRCATFRPGTSVKFAGMQTIPRIKAMRYSKGFQPYSRHLGSLTQSLCRVDFDRTQSISVSLRCAVGLKI